MSRPLFFVDIREGCGVPGGLRSASLHSGPSHSLRLRAPPPILVRGWTSPPAPHTHPSMHQAATFSSILGSSATTGSVVIGLFKV